MRHGHSGIRGLLALGLLLSSLWLVLAQPPGKRRSEEEETNPRPPTKKNINIDDEGPADRAGEPQAVELAQAAKAARHPAVRKLFEDLETPHDLVSFTNGKRPVPIEPIPQLADLRERARKLPADLRMVPLDPALKPFLAEAISTVQPYELLALKAVADFVHRDLTRVTEINPRPLPRLEQLIAAEQALRAVARFHESARERKVRDGEDWDLVEPGLRRQPRGEKHLLGLLDILVLQLEELVKTQDLDAALAMGLRLAETFPTKEEQELIARPLARLVKEALNRPLAHPERLREVRQKLEDLQRRFPDDENIKAVGESLKKKAAELVRQAKEPNRPKGEVDQLLHRAEELWPQLPELREIQQKLNQDYPILRVGVRQLPQEKEFLLSPGFATTDTELRAVELLFEGLMKVGVDKDGVQRFLPGLALGQPHIVSLGRMFHLPRNAYWSNDQPLTSIDVRYSLTQLRQGFGTGRSPAWGQLLDRTPVATDPFRVNVNLEQGYIAPLSLMTFKILPAEGNNQGAAAHEEEFARHPVGSGPFIYKGQDSRNDRRYATFQASLSYGSRAGKRNLPRIREIQLIQYVNPIDDLKNQRLDLLLDLTGKDVTELSRQAEGAAIKLPVPLPGNRRVYFLAVNHRHKHLKNLALRRALALAINREEVLDLEWFRDKKPDLHKALNAPLPAKSWPLDPREHSKFKPESLDPYDPDLARSLMKEVRQQDAGPIQLTLKYPLGDEAVRQAVDKIRDMVQKNTGIDLTLVGRQPHQLRKEVQNKPHDYELAYYHYDFPDETYWLGPLLGPHVLPEGGNYLNYENAQLETWLMEIQGLRDFPRVQKRMREIHQLLVAQMPVIPLWQLDPLLAIHKNVLAPPFDPWLVFSDIDQWKVDREGK